MFPAFSFTACIHRRSSTNLHAVHRSGGQVVGVLLVPAESEQWVVLGVFIDNSTVFEVTEVKHADRAVCSHWGKHIPAPARSAERDVIHLQSKQTARSMGRWESYSETNVYKYHFIGHNNTSVGLIHHVITFTSLSWAMSCVFTWPDTKLTLPSTCPVSSPQIVQVVSILEVPAQKTDTHKSWFYVSEAHHFSSFLCQ